MARVRKIAMFGALGAAGLLGAGAWTLLGVEDIPAQLEPAGDPDAIVIPGIGEQPSLALSQLRGKTAFFVMVGVANWGSDEGRRVNRALNRWQYPNDTVGYIVFDAEGFGFLAEQSQKYLREFSAEMRFPMYGDFEGDFRQVFKLAQGHHGLVVMGPGGELVVRRSGGIDDDEELTALRQSLGASEPPPGPKAPPFHLGSIDNDACAAKPCALMFLGRAVGRGDMPGVDDGFEGESEQRWAQMRKPEIRLVSGAMRLEPGEVARAVAVGGVSELELPGWELVTEAPAVREAFGIAPQQSAFLVVRGDEVSLRLEGLVPLYQFGQIADQLGVEFKRDD